MQHLRVLQESPEMTTLQKASELISRFEGFRSKPYQNPKDRPTVGYGSTFYLDGRPVKLSDPDISEDAAMTLLQKTVSRCIARVGGLCKVPLTQNQLTALTSFEYNTGALNNSTLLKELNQKQYAAAAKQFLAWDHVAGAVDPGLVKRRNQEMALFLSPDEEA